MPFWPRPAHSLGFLAGPLVVFPPISQQGAWGPGGKRMRQQARLCPRRAECRPWDDALQRVMAARHRASAKRQRRNVALRFQEAWPQRREANPRPRRAGLRRPDVRLQRLSVSLQRLDVRPQPRCNDAMPRCKGECLGARRNASVQGGMPRCKGECLGAGGNAVVQGGMPRCKEECLGARGNASAQGGMSRCKGECLSARGNALMQGGMLRRKAAMPRARLQCHDVSPQCRDVRGICVVSKPGFPFVSPCTNKGYVVPAPAIESLSVTSSRLATKLRTKTAVPRAWVCSSAALGLGAATRQEN